VSRRSPPRGGGGRGAAPGRALTAAPADARRGEEERMASEINAEFMERMRREAEEAARG